MRVAIGLVLALIAVVNSVVVVPEPDVVVVKETPIPVLNNSSHCVYLPESRVLSCRSIDETIECNAIANFSSLITQYPLFGIGKLAESFVVGGDIPIEQIQYFLYPRSLDNTTYLNYSVSIEDGGGESSVVDLVLYYGENFVNYGIRVLDLKCYERLVHLFSAVVDFHVISLVNEPVVGGGVQNVSLLGEILISDKNVQKRWLYGYGYWGYPYYGWYGYPYGSYWYGK